MGKTETKRNAADRYRRSLHVSTALAAILCVGTAGQPAFGQSVTATGDVNPFPSPNPLPVWDAGSTLSVGNSGTGTLRIEDGGNVSDTFGYIGTATGSNGTVTVSGAGSTWTNSSYLDVGRFGTGTLIVEGGGKVSTANGFIGLNASASGSSVTVSGTDAAGNASRWTNSSTLFVGAGGNGTLTVEKNGLVAAEWVNVGLGARGSGTINLIGNSPDGRGMLETAYVEKGAGSATLNLDGGILRATRDESDFLRGFGALTVGSGGAWFDTDGKSVTIGGSTTFLGSSSFNKIGLGTLTLTGDSSTHTGNTVVRGGTLTIAGGGTLGSSIGLIGFETGSNGTVMVSGAGSTWINTGSLYVGGSGTGTLTVSNGGKISNSGGVIGYFAGSEGHATVTDVGSTWTSTGNLSVGYWNTGTLTVSAGGTVSNSVGYIGYGLGSEGHATVTGEGSTWTSINGSLYVGYEGNGTLTVESGGKVSNTNGYIGSNTGSSGSSVIVSGTDAHGNASTWANSGSLYVGNSGIGTLTIEDGGKVSNTGGYIGGSIGASGSSVTVSGTDVAGNASTWTNASELYVGFGGMGTLEIEDGGFVSNTNGFIGFGNGSSSGSVTVSGTGAAGNASTWENADSLYVGYFDRGRLIVANGGKVSSAFGIIGNDPGAEGSVTVSGSDASGNASTWTNSGSLDVGSSGTGALTVSDGGTVKASTLNLGLANSGTLNIGAAAGELAVAAGTLDAASVQFRNGTGTLSFNHLGTTTFDAALISAGTGTHLLNHIGGITTLTGDSSGFTGTTTVSGGTLMVTNALGGSASVTDGSFVVDGTFGGDVAARTTGVLTGSGRITGNADLTGDGVLSGVSGQTLRVDGNVVMDATSTLNASLGAASNTALVSVGGDLALNGTLSVTDAGGFGAGVYRLMDYGGSLTGTGLAIGATPSGVGVANLSVQTSVANQVNLVSVSGAQLGFWDGGNAALHDNGAVDGGAGIWSAGGRNWTQADGTVNGPFQPIPTYAVFQNVGGVVTVDGSASAIGVTGMQFAADGYRVEGDSIALQGAGGTTTIRVGDGSTAGSSMTTAIASALTGSSTLVKSDYGTLILSGANTYGGGTQVGAGTLIGNVGSLRGDIGNAGTVVFDQTGNASFGGSIAGLSGTDGTMVKRGAGELTLARTSSLDWTIEAGRLTTDAGRFGGNAAILGGAGLTFVQAGNATYAGVLSGVGAFDLTGRGSVTLTGDSSAFTGMTTVGGGNTLIVGTSAGGKLGGSMTVGVGGLLGGTGTIGTAGSTVTIAAGAVHAPGNSIGVQTFLGNYANHGTLRIEAMPAAADRIVVAGSVDITGAALDLVISPTDASSWNAFNGPYTIIDKQSAGAIVGSFSPVTQNLLFLDAILDYAGGDGNDVTLALERNDLAVAGVGQTPNQIATGTAIDTLHNTNPIWRSIALSNDADIVRASFDALSGEIHASAKVAMIEDSRFLRNAVNDRIRAAFGSVGASTGPVVAFSDGGQLAAAATTDRFAVWGQGFGSWGKTNDDGNAATLNRSTGGFFIGADASIFNSWRLGVVTGYSRTSFNARDRFSSGSSDNYHVGLYGGTTWGDFAFRSGLAYTWHDIDTRRAVTIPGISDSLKADYNVATTQVFGELGYGIAAGGFAFEPFANLAYVDLHTDGFSEKDGVAALNGQSSTTDITFTTLGLRASTTFDLNGASLTATGTLGWRHAFGDVTPDTTMRFAAGGDPFTIAGVPIARDAAVVNAGLDLNLTPTATLGISYGRQFASGSTDQTFNANFNVRF